DLLELASRLGDDRQRDDSKVLQDRDRTDLLASDLKGFMEETSDYYRSLSIQGRPDLLFETGRDYLVKARASAIRCFPTNCVKLFSLAFASKKQHPCFVCF